MNFFSESSPLGQSFKKLAYHTCKYKINLLPEKRDCKLHVIVYSGLIFYTCSVAFDMPVSSSRKRKSSSDSLLCLAPIVRSETSYCDVYSLHWNWHHNSGFFSLDARIVSRSKDNQKQQNLWTKIILNQYSANNII